jgi:hypothetical protein
VNDSLQAAMLFADAEFIPDLEAATFDEVLAVRVIVDQELDDLIGPIAVAVLVAITLTVLLDEAIDRRHAIPNGAPGTVRLSSTLTSFSILPLAA